MAPVVNELAGALTKLVRQPFSDIKHAAFHALEALAGVQWGLQAVCSTPGAWCCNASNCLYWFTC